MADLLQRLKQRKIVQWAIAYVAFAFALIQVLDAVSDSYGWPHVVMHVVFGVLALGFVVTVILAWYHGERDAQRISGPELLLIALALAIGGGLLWHFARAPSEVASIHGPNATPHNPESTSSAAAARAPASAASTSASVANATSLIASQPIPAKSVAVLPFENLSTDKGNAYFADGMQDLILTKLADIGDLKVISRTSTEKYKSHPDDLKTIGQQLGVAAILEGSVQKAGNQVLINVQLIDAKTDSHIWAQSYQRTLDHIFGVEGEVAGKVATTLNAKLTAEENAAVTRVPTTNPQAYDDFLRALHFDNEAAKGDWADYLPQAIAMLEKAVAADPDFALAWAKLSGARTSARYWGVDRSEANLHAAEAAAKRALALAPKLPEAHTAMAGVQRFLYHDIQAAHDQNQQAVDLRPNDPDAFADLAISDAHLGHFHAAAKALRRAIDLDPTDSFSEFQLGLMLAATGDYAGARQAERRALALSPQNVQAYLFLSRIDVMQNGDVASATQVLDHMAPGTPVNVGVVTTRIQLLLYQRQYPAARALARQYTDKFRSGPAAIALTAARANIEWLAGKLPAAHALYRTMISMITASGSDLDAFDYAELGLAYARLGNANAAMQQIHTAITMDRRAHEDGGGIPMDEIALAQIQLALGRNSEAIYTLVQLLTGNSRSGGIVGIQLLTPALLKLDPTWDPIRHDPRFQALLKKYGQATPLSTSVATPAATASGTTNHD